MLRGEHRYAMRRSGRIVRVPCCGVALCRSHDLCRDESVRCSLSRVLMWLMMNLATAESEAKPSRLALVRVLNLVAAAAAGQADAGASSSVFAPAEPRWSLSRRGIVPIHENV